jgi:transitional endoplasmic reticulum ATPase
VSYDRQFEVLIGELYSRKGYQVELQKTVVGRSGAEHKFDGYCLKGRFRKRPMAFEAKYSANGLPVRVDDFSRFLTALDDCRIPEGHIVTNTYFSDNILSLAITYDIKLIDGNQLRKELRKYGLENAILRTNELLNSVGLPILKWALDSVDSSKTISRILIPRQQSQVLYLDLNPNSSFNRSLNEKFKNQLNLPYDSQDFSQNHKAQTQDKVNVEDLIVVEKPKISFSDIGGLQEVKDELRVAVTYRIIYRDLYKKFGIDVNNILMYGPPGCGKTLLAKAVAAETKGKFMAPKVSDVLKRYSADSLKFISSIFEYMRKEKENSVIFLDELDVYMKRGGSPYDTRIKNEFLQQMDGIASEKNFSIVGATNKPWLIDPAIRRPGRFDERIFIPPPDLEARKEIIRIHMRDLISRQMIADDIDALIENLASRTEGWSGADLKQLIENSKKRSLLDMIKGNAKDKLTLKDFEKVVEKQKPSIKPWFSEAVRACKRYGERDLLEEILENAPESCKKEINI